MLRLKERYVSDVAMLVASVGLSRTGSNDSATRPDAARRDHRLMSDRVCMARREARGDRPCTDPPSFDIIVRVPGRSEPYSVSPACWTHGLAEVDRAQRSGGMTTVEMVEHFPRRILDE